LANALVDNDLIEKMARWQCLDHLPPSLSVEHEAVLVLGVLRYVVGARLRRTHGEPVCRPLMEFLDLVSVLEPSEDEVSLAASIEEISLAEGLDIDVGESQLFAVALMRAETMVATGDKRAVCSCAGIEPDFPEIAGLRGRIISTEQVLARLLGLLDHGALRARVCADKSADKTAEICFCCSSEDVPVADVLSALESYQKDLAKRSKHYTLASLERLSLSLNRKRIPIRCVV